MGLGLQKLINQKRILRFQFKNKKHLNPIEIGQKSLKCK